MFYFCSLTFADDDYTNIKIKLDSVFCSTDNEEARDYFNQGVNYVDNNKIDSAIILYLKAIELDPEYCDAMDNLGQLYRRINKFDKAEYWYNKSLKINLLLYFWHLLKK